MLCIPGLPKSSIEQYNHTFILFPAYYPPGTLFDSNETGKSKRVIETIESQRIEIILNQLLLGIGLRQADTDDDGSNESITPVIDAFGKSSSHDGKPELPVSLEKTGEKLLLSGFVKLALLQ